MLEEACRFEENQILIWFSKNRQRKLATIALRRRIWKSLKRVSLCAKHEVNSMKKTTLKSDEVWYVDSGASNHMTLSPYYARTNRRRGTTGVSNREEMEVERSTLFGPIATLVARTGRLRTRTESR